MRRVHFLAGTIAGIALPAAARAARAPVNVLYAGSLVTIMERSIGPGFAKTGFDYRGEGKGSVALANMIRDGLRNPDVFISADPKVLDQLMTDAGGKKIAWYANFASTRIVVGFSPKSPLAAAFRDAQRDPRKLQAALEQPNLRLVRTDPRLDPKGYRTIIAMRLLEKAWNAPGFATKVLGADENPSQIVPEEALLVRLESGEADAGFLYSTESGARNLPAVELPAIANLGDPREAATYASASVTIDGTTRSGAPILYGLTIPSAAPNRDGAVAFVNYLLSPAGRTVFERAGIGLLTPRITGDVASVPAGLSFSRG